MRTSTKFAIAVWAVFFAAIVLDGTLPPDIVESGAYKFGMMIVIAIAIFAWFLGDAKEHDFQPSPLLRVAVVAIAIFALTYYRFRYMGVKRGFIFLANVVVYACLVILAGVATVLAVHNIRGV